MYSIIIFSMILYAKIKVNKSDRMYNRLGVGNNVYNYMKKAQQTVRKSKEGKENEKREKKS